MLGSPIVKGHARARDAFEMDSENGRLAPMEGFSFYNVPEIRAKLDISIYLRVELQANE